ncbi:MAG TPA: hypothetical protein PLK94_06130, partial [Alphaproteobacteria bacterium]|nr:hypothetical protein [Alphaproteobacteria bacterium]
SSKSAPLSSLLPSRTTRIFNMLTKEYISGEFAKHQMAEDLSQLGIAAKVIYDKHAGNLEFELKRAPQDISSSARALEN